MNLNDYSSLQNNTSASDSSLYGNGSVYSLTPQAQTGAYGACAYPSRMNASAGVNSNAPSQNRSVYDSGAAGSGVQRQAGGGAPSGSYHQTRNSAQGYDTRINGSSGAQHYRTNYNVVVGEENAVPKLKPASGSANGSSSKGAASASVQKPPKDKVTSGSGSGSGSNKGGGSSGKKPPKKKTLKQRFLAWLKRFLRSIYLMEKPIRIFLASVSGFVLICVIVIISVSGSRQKRAEAISAEVVVSTPVPTIAATATPEPTPSPTPEVRIERGAEGEDVMALQKRLMELGYLAIDEPTSHFGSATKAAVMLFQRQHALQQDGICGNETITMIYAEEAKPYVMSEGEEGDDIQSFQEQLVELGYLESNQVTSYYGTDTVDAVKSFQHRNYLTKDGKAGEQTLEAINSPDARVSYTKEQEIIAEKKKQAALARASSSEGRIDKLIAAAKKQLGDPYILGKTGPDTFDCSGLVVYCLHQANVYTRRLNAAGLSKTTSWTKISDIDNVQRGDLLFFKSDDSSGIGHVGIYIGNGEMIDASSANGKVVRRGAKTSYWRRNFVVARRPIK